MSRPSLLRGLTALFALLLALAPLSVRHPSAPLTHAQTAAPADVITLSPLTETEPNDAITPSDQANPIGLAQPQDAQVWQQTITGSISAADDIDWYRVRLAPASTIAISLTNLPADYDLALGSAANDQESGESGLEDVLDVGGGINAIGGGINAIGGGINAIGGGINAIGGGINAIGGGINAIGGGINAISANRDTTSETINTFLWQPGIYYIAVVGNNGAFSNLPYTLQVQVTGSTLSIPPPAPEVQLNILANPNITTLYIVSSERMRRLYPGNDTYVAGIRATLGRMATSTPGNGYVLDLNDVTTFTRIQETVAQIYERWDGLGATPDSTRPANPLEANRVARMIDNLITAATVRNPSGPTPSLVVNPTGSAGPAPFPNVRHIVIVGGDSVIPFFRVPDLSSIANETDYAAYLRSIDAAGVIDPNSPQGAALRYRTLQTDNVYGADKAYRFFGYPLYIPNRATGRLVEQPIDIAQFLDRFVNSQTIDTRFWPGALVTGYDFLIDQAQEVSRTLTTIGFSNTAALSVTGLIDDNWTSQNLEQTWFDGQLDSAFGPNYSYFSRSPYRLQSLNAHFDHWQIIPAKTTEGTFYAERIFTPTVNIPVQGAYFDQQLAYSVGCHSGLNVRDENVLTTTPNTSRYQADFAQAFLKQGGHWIGNTGYGYGSLDTVDYSERLSVLFTQELGRDVRDLNNEYFGQAIGTALVNAKQRYLRNATSLGPYDAKVLTIMTLYGLPFTRVYLNNPQPAPPEERPDAPATTPRPPVPTQNFGTLTRVLTFTLSDAFQTTTVPRTGSQYLTLDEAKIQVEDSFVRAGFDAQPEVRVFQASQLERPVLPQFAYDISALGSDGSSRLVVRDVSFIGGVYSELTDYNPQITQIVTETDSPLNQTNLEPGFEEGAEIWYPDKFFGKTTVGEGEEQRDQLVASAAQFRAEPDGTVGTMRPYEKMVFAVNYVDPSASDASKALNDQTAPAIESVRITPNPNGRTRQVGGVQVIVTVTDDVVPGDPNSTGLDGVKAVYIVNNQTWTPISFTLAGNAANGAQRWVANVPVGFGELRLIVSATDKAGNTSFYTAKGLFEPPQPQVLIPIVRR